MTKQESMEKIEVLVKQARALIDEAGKLADDAGVSFLFNDQQYGPSYAIDEFTERGGWRWADSGCSYPTEEAWNDSGCTGG